MRYFITKNMLVGLIAVLTAALVLALLSGCATTNETRSGQSQTIVEHHPLADGGFVEKRTTVDSSDSTSTTKADVDWGGLVSRGVGAAAGGDWAALGGVAATAIAAGGAALMKHREAQANKRDADEAWDRLMAEKDKRDA